MTTSTLMTVVMNSMSLRCRETKHALKRTFIQKDTHFILLHGCSFVEGFNKFRLCGSAASHASTKLPATTWQLSLSDSENEKINKQSCKRAANLNKISQMPYPRANKDNQIPTPCPASPSPRRHNIEVHNSSGFRVNVSFVDCTSVFVKSVLEASLSFTYIL